MIFKTFREAESDSKTPRQIREAIASNRWILESRAKLLDPPQEWPEYRREALRLSLEVTVKYLRGRHSSDLARKLGVSRQMIARRVQTGIYFLISRNYLRPNLLQANVGEDILKKLDLSPTVAVPPAAGKGDASVREA